MSLLHRARSGMPAMRLGFAREPLRYEDIHSGPGERIPRPRRDRRKGRALRPGLRSLRSLRPGRNAGSTPKEKRQQTPGFFSGSLQFSIVKTLQFSIDIDTAAQEWERCCDRRAGKGGGRSCSWEIGKGGKLW